MGTVQSYVIASLSLCSVYLGYVHIYCSYKLLKTNVLRSDKLPSFFYLYSIYWIRALARTTGHLYTTTKQREAVYTVLENRVEAPVLRRFCSAAGYGWDYPDTQFRDIPLCFPEFLCDRLLLTVLTAENFRLSPARLLRVRQSLRSFEPVDELKRGPFVLQGRVLVYRHVDAGVEVDICLSATSCIGHPIWESVVTLLSKTKCNKGNRCSNESDQQSGRPDEPVPDNVKQVEVRVPWRTGLQCVWSSSELSLCQLLSLPAGLFGYRSQTTPSLWMLSVCLAEVEKSKGVEVITAPVKITTQFKEPLLAPGKVTIQLWEKTGNGGLSFQMQQYGRKTSLIEGQISSIIEKFMKNQKKGSTASIPLSSSTGSIGVQVYHDYQKVSFKMYPGNGHATENSSQSKVTSPDVVSNGQDQQCGMNDEFHRNSMWMLDSSSQACSGPEENSTDPHDLTESSTLTFVDGHTMEDSGENHSAHGVAMVYFKEFVLIDDDDDGDMSLREKTVTDLSNMDGKAADLVCGRLLSTSSGTVSESKDESPDPEAPPPAGVDAAHKNKPCCFCTLL